MARKKSQELDRDGMSLPVKLLFMVIFFAMGGSILGAGFGGQPATAPIVMTIGMLMILIGLAPFYVPLLYDRLVPEEAALSA